MAKGKSNSSLKRSAAKPQKERRVILFPTEPTSIPREELARAVERVIAARKN